MRRVFHALQSPKAVGPLVGMLAVGLVAAILVWSPWSGASPSKPKPPRSTTSSSTGLARGGSGSALGADPATATGGSSTRGAPDPRQATTTTAPNPNAPAGSPGGASAGFSNLPAPGIVIGSATFDLPDPYLLDWGGTYYMYVSTPFGDTQQNAPVIEGRPGDWRGPIDVLPDLPPWAQQQYTWTPAVYHIGSNWVMYFAALLAGSSFHCIGVAVLPDSLSPSPDRPFLPNPTPLQCNTEHGGDIDPQMFDDPTGPNGPANPYYLVWKADSNSINQAPTFWAQGLSKDGMTLTGLPHEIYGPNLPGRRPAWERGYIEAPQMVKDPSGQLWLFFSGGGIFNSPTYAMGYARCQSEFGPCSDTTTVPLISSNRQGVGPGEETVFQGPDGSTWLLYNPWHAGQWFNWVRPAEAARIAWRPSGPAVVIPPPAFPAP